MTTEAEAKKIAAIVNKRGWCEVHSSVLEDTVIFAHDHVQSTVRELRPNRIVYTYSELKLLFGEDRPHQSASDLRLIHGAKKMGCVVTENA